MDFSALAIFNRRSPLGGGQARRGRSRKMATAVLRQSKRPAFAETLIRSESQVMRRCLTGEMGRHVHDKYYTYIYIL
jgi:hypothetical protein